MHIHLPKPIHGWREFLGEVGIIVVGILLALGAEELLQARHWRDQVDAFQDAVAVEIGFNLGTYNYRLEQNACTNRRIVELETWWRSWNDGRPLHLTGPIGLPTSLSVHASVWTSRTPDISGHLAPEARLSYAQLYDELQNNEVHRLAEREAWISLGDYDGAQTLDHQDLIRIRGLLNQVRLRQDRFMRNIPAILRDARALAMTAKSDPMWPKKEPAICSPVLPKGA